MNAPKKIWMVFDDDGCGGIDSYQAPKNFGSEYIRADIVEEMREALEGLVEYVGKDHAGVGLADLHNKGIYALKRLEEE